MQCVINIIREPQDKTKIHQTIKITNNNCYDKLIRTIIIAATIMQRKQKRINENCSRDDNRTLRAKKEGSRVSREPS